MHLHTQGPCSLLPHRRCGSDHGTVLGMDLTATHCYSCLQDITGMHLQILLCYMHMTRLGGILSFVTLLWSWMYCQSLLIAYILTYIQVPNYCLQLVLRWAIISHRVKNITHNFVWLQRENYLLLKTNFLLKKSQIPFQHSLAPSSVQIRLIHVTALRITQN